MGPEYWAQGHLKPLGIAPSTSDIFFVAHFMKRASSQLGEVHSVSDGVPPSLVTKQGEHLLANVIVKACGFEAQASVGKLLGRSHMNGVGLMDLNLWLIAEGGIDENFLNTPFGSSW